MDIADYDSTHYDYEKYWQGREYEDIVEQSALRKLLPPKGRNLIDLGGGFGRHLKHYIDSYQYVTLLDYSQENLNKASRVLGPQAKLIKGDIYHLPFGNNIFDAGMMIRVMHHLEKPEVALREVYRVMKPGSIFVLEYANKVHFKARIRQGVKFSSNLDPYNQLTAESGIFFNFHPLMLEKIITDLGWQIKERLSASNFRSPLLKKIVPLPILVKLDEVLQRPLAAVNFGPSVFLKLIKSN